MNGKEFARILSKGKSFEYSKWDSVVQYTNDCFKQDFVSHNNALFACIKSHMSCDDNMPDVFYENGELLVKNSEYWDLVVTGGRSIINDDNPDKEDEETEKIDTETIRNIVNEILEKDYNNTDILKLQKDFENLLETTCSLDFNEYFTNDFTH